MELSSTTWRTAKEGGGKYVSTGHLTFTRPHHVPGVKVSRMNKRSSCLSASHSRVKKQKIPIGCLTRLYSELPGKLWEWRAGSEGRSRNLNVTQAPLGAKAARDAITAGAVGGRVSLRWGGGARGTSESFTDAAPSSPPEWSEQPGQHQRWLGRWARPVVATQGARRPCVSSSF